MSKESITKRFYKSVGRESTYSLLAKESVHKALRYEKDFDALPEHIQKVWYANSRKHYNKLYNIHMREYEKFNRLAYYEKLLQAKLLEMLA